VSVLSDTIEKFIKSLINEYEGKIEIQRNELADYFCCAPSQINYVLATRFTLGRGYVIESRRGGGGYIRVVRIETDKDDYLFNLITKRIGESITERDAKAMIIGLFESGTIMQTQKALMLAAVSNKALNIPAMVKDQIRANVLKQMILAVIKEEEK